MFEYRYPKQFIVAAHYFVLDMHKICDILHLNLDVISIAYGADE
jgi:hypothetical protein